MTDFISSQKEGVLILALRLVCLVRKLVDFFIGLVGFLINRKLIVAMKASEAIMEK